jgi:hypothetical protein
LRHFAFQEGLHERVLAFGQQLLGRPAGNGLLGDGIEKDADRKSVV